MGVERPNFDTIIEVGTAATAIGLGIATVGRRPAIGAAVTFVGSVITGGALLVSERRARVSAMPQGEVGIGPKAASRAVNGVGDIFE